MFWDFTSIKTFSMYLVSKLKHMHMNDRGGQFLLRRELKIYEGRFGQTESALHT